MKHAAGVALGFAVLVAAVPARAQLTARSPCDFEILWTHSMPSTSVTRVPAVRLLAQSDSPVAVTNFVAPSLMFTPPPNVEVRNAQNSFTMSVRNVSDRLVRSVQLYVQVRSSLGIIGGGPAITRALAPGEWAYVRSDGAIAQAMVNEPGVWVLVGVESVTFEECEYRPSQPAQTFPRVR